MSNREPTTPLLRRRDVLSWLPKLDRRTLEEIAKQAEQDGTPITSQPGGPGTKWYYLRDPLKKRLGIG